MSRSEKGKSTYFYSALLYLCSFFLFLEWIYPLGDVTDTTGIPVFIGYTLYCFVISFLPLRWWMSFVLKGLGLLFFVHWLFFNHIVIFSVDWMAQIVTEISYNSQALLSQDWYYLTPLFRTMLFLVLIWLMSYLLHYWFVEMKRIFLFILLTFIYITVLDTFTAYDAGVSIVRAFIISLLALAIATVHKEFSHVSIGFSWLKGLKSLFIPLVVIVTLSTIIGFLFPKVDPQWPDPVPFLYSAAGGDFGTGDQVKKVGYGEDDSRLGGSFVQDYTPVFTAYVMDRHYWRIETKDIYTGKGWELSSPPDYQEQVNGEIHLSTFSNQVMSEQRTATLDMHQFSAAKLIYPYGVYQASELRNGATGFALDKNSEAIETKTPNELDELVFQIDYNRPSFDINQLSNQRREDPRAIVEKYTQLPSTLPSRVQQLAEEITQDAGNRYDQAKAIEQFFHQNGFEYKTKDVPVPEADVDYVDQFLFDTKYGYCDNFSTSMVVLLRTLDIPARWVKGFTSGEQIENNMGQEPDVYEVTNANAHSWVEVYFPDIGWVPFEPTQGFESPADFYYGETDSIEMDQEEPRENIQEEVEEKVEQNEEVVEEATPTFSFLMGDGNFSKIKQWLGIISVLLVLVGMVYLYKRRYYIVTKRYVNKWNDRPNAEQFQNAYHHLLKLLDHKGFTKGQDQTLREYARWVDADLETNEMSQLTSYYERMLYSNGITDHQLNEVAELWKNFVNRIMG